MKTTLCWSEIGSSIGSQCLRRFQWAVISGRDVAPRATNGQPEMRSAWMWRKMWRRWKVCCAAPQPGRREIPRFARNDDVRKDVRTKMTT